MFTSYYRNPHILKSDYKLISISRTISPWVFKVIPEHRLTHLPILAPSWNLLLDYKNGNITTEEYCITYNNYLLCLDPQQIYDVLQDDCILLCYESPKEFCHRHLVADWFNRTLDLDVKEFDAKSIKPQLDGFIFNI